MKSKFFALLSLLAVCALLPLTQGDGAPAASAIVPATEMVALAQLANAPAMPASEPPAPVASNVKLLSQTGGTTNAVAIQGDYAYLGIGPRLAVVDVRSPSTPLLLGVTQPFDGLVEDVVVAGSYAYVAARSAGLIVVDIADPAKPQQTGFYDTPGEAAGVTLADSYPGYAFVADLSGGLRVIDIRHPAHPKETGFYDPADFATSSVAIQGGYAYVTAYLSGLHVLDLSDLTQPQLANIYQPSTGVLSVAVADGYAYVGEEYYGLRVLDISDPANPLPVGLCAQPMIVRDLVVAGDYAYVNYLGTGLYLVQITDPANPTVVGWYPYLYQTLPVPVRDLALAGSLVYLANDTGGLRVIDVSDPALPVTAGVYQPPLSGASNVSASGAFAYAVQQPIHAGGQGQQPDLPGTEGEF